MSETIRFKRIVRVNIVKGLKREVLKLLLESITSKYKSTMKNAFQLSDFANYLTVENLTDDYKKEILYERNGFDFITIVVDEDYYKHDFKFTMLRDFYDATENTLRHKEIEMVAYSKVYNIERPNENELKIEGFPKVYKNIDLQHLKPEYRIK